METRTERSEATLGAIVDTALDMALAEGLDSLSLGEVAKRAGMSKSGVFSRIGSREALQKAVIDEYGKRFIQEVFVPAMREPRGLPRLDAIMRLSIDRFEGNVVQRAVRMATAGEVTATDGSTLRFQIDTLCVHGDTAGAAELTRLLRAGLEQHGVAVGAVGGA